MTAIITGIWEELAISRQWYDAAFDQCTSFFPRAAIVFDLGGYEWVSLK
jgi:hypothetical protein